ncbi:hypothetical protein [Flavobacterium crassostreae]|uniref:Adenylosuccinate synthetase n=1 Tax=Flavobacterium crassostreae TaxID=1763534 RepID=A0A1B9DXG6_9FLAO|nr:hypothetical protein [Flavobacterium crassostreae]OCB74375.1 hypothetical protein LPBF_10270 [Flavobacterium crassostreae]
MCNTIKFRLGSLFLLFVLFSANMHAQCAMCRAALGGEDNNIQAQAVNDGIVYLMAIPYILVAVIGYAVYRLYKNKKQV